MDTPKSNPTWRAKEREHVDIIHLLPSGIGEGQLPGRHQFQLLRIDGPKKSLTQRCALAVENQTVGAQMVEGICNTITSSGFHSLRVVSTISRQEDTEGHWLLQP